MQFPTAQLVEQADYLENIANAWDGPEKAAKELQRKTLAKAKHLRAAISAYQDLEKERDEWARLCAELQDQLAMMVNAPAAK